MHIHRSWPEFRSRTQRHRSPGRTCRNDLCRHPPNTRRRTRRGRDRRQHRDGPGLLGIGRRIVEAQGERAEYGKRLLHYLAQRLTAEFGPGFDESNLRNMRRFLLSVPDSGDAVSRSELVTLQRPDKGSRSGTSRFLRPRGSRVRLDRTPTRQISTLFYERLLAGRPRPRSRYHGAVKQSPPSWRHARGIRSRLIGSRRSPAVTAP